MSFLLAVSGDPGGSKTLLPVLSCLEKQNIPFAVVCHRFLDAEAPAQWLRVSPPEATSPDITKWFRELCCMGVIFTSSIDDKLPLEIARAAQCAGLPVIHLLDHWSHYVERLQTDNLPKLLPDIYTVMDEIAYKEAISAGIPDDVLEITGHPSLSTLIDEHQEFLKYSDREHLERLGFSSRKTLIVFISEPIEQYAGTCYVPDRAGYNEKTVLRRLSNGLQRFADDIQLAIVPHPREDANGLLNAWNLCKGSLEGTLLKLPKGRQALFLAEGVIGMNSILMHEAWLLGQPVLSFQPWDSPENIINILRKEGVLHIMNKEDGQSTILEFLGQVRRKKGQIAYRPELQFHKNASERVVQCLRKVLSKYLMAGEKS